MAQHNIFSLRPLEVIGAFSSIIGLYIAFPLVELSTWIMIILILIIVSSLYYLIRIYLTFKKLIKEFVELNGRHNALSLQFDRKSNLLEKYEFAYEQIGYCIILSMHISEEQKLHNIYKIYLSHQNYLKENDL